jgi:hypothetical protein
MYQVLHPWHWLTSGRNATAFGIVLAAALNLATIVVLTRTLRAVNKQATAADRQAEAAEEQVTAAASATAVSKAQLSAAEESARAEREHSDLIRQQLLAALRPVIVIGRQPHPAQAGTQQYFAANHGEGLALEVVCQYADTPADHVPLMLNIIGRNAKSIFSLDMSHARKAGLQLKYRSQDGRYFLTKVEVTSGEDCEHETFEVNNLGGFLRHWQ